MSNETTTRAPFVPKGPDKDWNLRIRGATLEGGEYPSSLAFEIYNGRPRIVYRTGLPGAVKDVLITAAFSLHGFNSHLVLLEKVVKGELDGFMVDTKGNPVLENGERSKEIKTLVRVKVERNTDGVITYTVSGGPDRPRGEFELLPDEYHAFTKADRTPLEPKLVSEIVAQGVIETWRPVMAALASQYGATVAAPTAPTASGGDGGGYQKKPWQGNNQGGGNQGGYQKKEWGGNNQQGGYQKKPWQGNQGGGNQGGYQKKPWQGGGGNNQGGGGYQKKPWQGNQGGNQGGYQKKEWNGNQGGGQQGGYQKKQWQGNQQGNQGGGQQFNADKFDDTIPF